MSELASKADLRFSRRFEEIRQALRHNSTLTVPISGPSTLLLYAESAHNADMRYFSGMLVPDAFVAWRIDGKKIGIINALEFGRALKESSFDTVLPLEPLREKARSRWPQITPGIAEIVMVAAEDLKVSGCVVPEDFPSGLFQKLRGYGLSLEVAPGAILPEREIKSSLEARAIKEGNRIAAEGIGAAEQTLRASRIKSGKIIYKGQPLTSERLKFVIESACLAAGGVSLHTIAAGGNQACDPHDRGSGPLRANELIIVDVFPSSNRTGYHGDMTRTFLKGRSNEAQRALVNAVREAQTTALKLIRGGVNGRDVHKACVDTFEKRGFETKSTPKGSIGFFHGTGHGLGLAIHELPRLSGMVDSILKPGAVVTVEPGLYYPGVGGCRIEDVVQVTDGRPKMLSSFHYDWEIR